MPRRVAELKRLVFARHSNPWSAWTRWLSTPLVLVPLWTRRWSHAAIVGAWMADRGLRDRVVVATKASPMDKEHPLSAPEIRAAADRSLANLQTDVIDLYYAHFDDEATPLEETLQAFEELVQAGKIRYAAVSNYSPERLVEAVETAATSA